MSDGEITAVAILLAGLLAAEAEGRGQSPQFRRDSAELASARAAAASTAA